MTRHSIHLPPLTGLLAYSAVLALAGHALAATVVSTFVIVVALINLRRNGGAA